MTDRKGSYGRELAVNDPADPGAEGDDVRDFWRLLKTLLAKHGLRVAVEKQLQTGCSFGFPRGR